MCHDGSGDSVQQLCQRLSFACSVCGGGGSWKSSDLDDAGGIADSTAGIIKNSPNSN